MSYNKEYEKISEIIGEAEDSYWRSFCEDEGCDDSYRNQKAMQSIAASLTAIAKLMYEKDRI